jgi:hypothetical protein
VRGGGRCCQVINALTDDKISHVPYRDSKLTRVLQVSPSHPGLSPMAPGIPFRIDLSRKRRIGALSDL